MTHRIAPVLLFAALLPACKLDTEAGPRETLPKAAPDDGSTLAWGEAYRIEVHTDRTKQEVRVNVLDRATGEPAAVAAPHLTLALSRPECEVVLAAVSGAGEPAGKASAFVGTLPEVTRGRKLVGTVSADIEGQAYAAEFQENPCRHCRP
jgi:hypothetical protein